MSRAGQRPLSEETSRKKQDFAQGRTNEKRRKQWRIAACRTNRTRSVLWVFNMQPEIVARSNVGTSIDVDLVSKRLEGLRLLQGGPPPHARLG